jgi:hypothetical protein
MILNGRSLKCFFKNVGINFYIVVTKKATGAMKYKFHPAKTAILTLVPCFIFIFLALQASSQFNSDTAAFRILRRLDSVTNSLKDSTGFLSQKIDSLQHSVQADKSVSFPVVFSAIIAPLVVALITFLATTLWNYKRTRKRLDDAPRKYVEELDKLIKRGMEEGITKAIINARAIVSARDSLRSSLISISAQLNTEIDVLATNIGTEYLPSKNVISTQSNEGYNNPEEAYRTIEVLSRLWPSRKTQIEIQVRKMLAEMGLDYSRVM